MIYQAYQAHSDLMWPMRTVAKSALPALQRARDVPGEDMALRKLAAACEVFVLAALTHARPPFRLDTITSGEREVAVQEEVAHRTPFGTLLHFRKDVPDPGPRVLIVAPMSGHFATLLRDTARTMLADHDVYITDWHNARDVPAMAGRFGLDEYIEHVMAFLRAMGPGSHLMAICQPCVAALAAVALMSEDDDPAVPASLTLMAGPIDCRIAPTEVNKLASDKPIDVVRAEPDRHGAAALSRRDAPRVSGLPAADGVHEHEPRAPPRFVPRPLPRSRQQRDREGRRRRRRSTRSTSPCATCRPSSISRPCSEVFQEYALPQGKLKFRDRTINPAAIRRTALLTVEGERDDICSLGQTLAAHDLCTGLRQFMRTHYVQAGVGHYGVFSGRRWSGSIYPVVRDVIHVSQ